MPRKVVLVTGCSSGFGYLSTLKFAREDWQVFAGVRNFDLKSKQLETIARKENLKLKLIELDVTKDKQVKQVVNKILTDHPIDVLINNAGFGYLGPVEEFTIDEVKTQFDTNFYGALRITWAVLSSMREQGSGTIINVSSINGLLSFGMYGIYSASKFALETTSEVLRFEVKKFGINVVLVEPGGFHTNFSQNSKRPKHYLNKNSAYHNYTNPISRDSKFVQRSKTNPFFKRITDPKIVADKLFEIANDPNPNLRYKIGLDTRFYTFLHKLVPQSIWFWALHKIYKW